MQKLRQVFLALILSASVVIPMQALAATPANTVGRILLQVESAGEAWYVDPVREERFYLKDGDAAFAALRNFGLGITDADLALIPIGLEDRFSELDSDGDGLGDQLEQGIGTDPHNPDSDGDGFTDYAEVKNQFNPSGAGEVAVDSELVDRLRGRILLQVEASGEAWYVHPTNGKRYYMSTGGSAYEIMRFLSLGITDANLGLIPLYSQTVDCNESLSCLMGLVEYGIPAKMVFVLKLSSLGPEILVRTRIEHGQRNADGKYTYKSTMLEQTIGGEANNNLVGIGQMCVHDDIPAMLDVFRRWGESAISTSDMDFAECEQF